MCKDLIQQLLKYFKDNYGYEINNSTDLFETQRDLLEFVMRLGRGLEKAVLMRLGLDIEESIRYGLRIGRKV